MGTEFETYKEFMQKQQKPLSEYTQTIYEKFENFKEIIFNSSSEIKPNELFSISYGKFGCIDDTSFHEEYFHEEYFKELHYIGKQYKNNIESNIKQFKNDTRMLSLLPSYSIMMFLQFIRIYGNYVEETCENEGVDVWHKEKGNKFIEMAKKTKSLNELFSNPGWPEILQDSFNYIRSGEISESVFFEQMRYDNAENCKAKVDDIKYEGGNLYEIGDKRVKLIGKREEYGIHTEEYDVYFNPLNIYCVLDGGKNNILVFCVRGKTAYINSIITNWKSMTQADFSGIIKIIFDNFSVNNVKAEYLNPLIESDYCLINNIQYLNDFSIERIFTPESCHLENHERLEGSFSFEIKKKELD